MVPPTEATSQALNEPPRSAERAALEIAVKELRRIERKPNQARDTFSWARAALADITALVPDLADGSGT